MGGDGGVDEDAYSIPKCHHGHQHHPWKRTHQQHVFPVFCAAVVTVTELCQSSQFM